MKNQNYCRNSCRLYAKSIHSCNEIVYFPVCNVDNYASRLTFPIRAAGAFAKANKYLWYIVYDTANDKPQPDLDPCNCQPYCCMPGYPGFIFGRHQTSRHIKQAASKQKATLLPATWRTFHSHTRRRQEPCLGMRWISFTGACQRSSYRMQTLPW